MNIFCTFLCQIGIWEFFHSETQKRGFPHFCLEICVSFWLRWKNSDHTSFFFNRIPQVWIYNLFQYAPACPNPLHLTRFNPLQTAPTISIRPDSVHSNPLLTTPFHSRQMAKYRKRFSNQNNLNVQRISAVNTFAISNASPSVQLLTQISNKEFVPLLLLSRQYCPHRTIIGVLPLFYVTYKFAKRTSAFEQNNFWYFFFDMVWDGFFVIEAIHSMERNRKNGTKSIHIFCWNHRYKQKFFIAL